MLIKTLKPETQFSLHLLQALRSIYNALYIFYLYTVKINFIYSLTGHWVQAAEEIALVELSSEQLQAFAWDTRSLCQLPSCIDLLSCNPLLLHIHLLNHWLPKSDPCIDEPVGHLHYQILELWKVISPCFRFQPLQMFPLGINLLSGGLIHKAVFHPK